MVLIGEAAEKIKQAYADKVFTVDATDIDEAVRTAFDQARRCKGMVLLSPMCASFDMFRDYEDRGERFKQAVVHLKAYKEHNAQ
jgi:UDP-N-acetylmuramoylalanine--D-glutamate ligase